MQPPAKAEMPWLPPEAVAALEKALTPDSVYVEYGSGSSTLFALRHAGLVVAVESDREWMEQIRQRAAEQGGPGKFEPLPVDIGITGLYGYPVSRQAGPFRLRRWLRYIEAPWQAERERVDVVLIDGRFRVACTLRSLIATRAQETLFILDDFADKVRGYDAVLPFITDVTALGAAISFRRAPAFDDAGAWRLVQEHVSDPA